MSARDQLRRAGRRLDLTRLMGSGVQLVARFGLIGLLAFVVDVGLFNLARHALDLGPLTSKTISVAVATTVAFLGNRSWTFSERQSQHGARTAYVLFFVFNGIGLAISLGCLYVSTYLLALTSPLAENISSNVVGLALGTLFRFWAYERWVFPGAPNGQFDEERDLVDALR
ncbi:Putative flippase GtrA (transmembrane translocase of bactoprenol-linked glucose) [Nocardioides scoriae]|uniref:Putative flippase GtrA (Transmembrane translocase of bactoprenol-linked glucose) n=1 Tax=Nocardioides scoriae TaxID=642780 RepID=A0A1H1LKV1_9ACTN|nr:GtrA family protein [Nocardioides scoriae]SDR74499.1 Putative flippase GtrA (transmembrane translocase of bactoprenol-linked glucose) [Nocardioides scoriae]